MNQNKRSHVFIITMLCLILAMTGIISYAAFAPSTTTVNAGRNGGTNPDDLVDYIVEKDENGMLTISQTVKSGDQNTFLGVAKKNGDYMYVYGYYYNREGAPTMPATQNGVAKFKNDAEAKAAGWYPQPTDLGWGCAALSKTKTSYANPVAVLDNFTVTWMNYCYAGCTKFAPTAENQWQLPLIPSTVKHTDYMFAKCTQLTKVSITTAHSITANTFSGCSNITKIFVGQNLESIAANGLKGVSTNCVVTVEKATKPSGYVTNWNAGTKQVVYDGDILIWSAI